jgi:tRNA(Ile)-lysidine synthase
LFRLWPEPSGEPELKLGLAVSGGPDSLAMLLLAQAAIPGQVEAATVDHGLRTEAADEAALAGRLCDQLGVPHQTLRVTVADGNLQASARSARYAALGTWAAARGIAALATAHHADDQAETLLMRLNRGSGVAGLAGVRARGMVPGSKITLLRPLLSWRRAELALVLSGAGVAGAQDPSNEDERFDRVRIRRELADAPWIDPLALAASASHLAEADAALDWAAAREWHECVVSEGGVLRYIPSAPRAVRLRLVARIIAELGGSPRGGGVARLVDLLEAGEAGSLGGIIAKVKGGAWVFQLEPPRSNPG